MNALTLLRDDHRTVEALFKQFEKLGDNAHGAKKKLVDKIVRELSIHSAIEEQVFYPAVRATIEDAEDEVLEGLEEHHIVKWTLSELTKMKPTDERFDAKVTVLIESVRHHIGEEQDELFPKVRKHLDRKELETLGKALAAAKKVVPTRPHPRAPDSPPGNLVAGVGASILDHARDFANSVVTSGRKKLARSRANGKARGGKQDSASAAN